MIELPPVRTVVREARCYETQCPQCGQRQRASYPTEFGRGQVVGANLARLVVYLHHAHPLSYQRVQTVLRELYGLHLSQGTLVNIVQRSQAALQQAATHIHQQVCLQAVLGSDETSVRVQGHNYWQWVFQSPSWVYMRIHRRRTSTVVHAVMSTHRPLVWVSDLGAAQLHHPACHFQVCLAHQVRDLQYVIDTHQCPWASQL